MARVGGSGKVKLFALHKNGLKMSKYLIKDLRRNQTYQTRKS